MATGIFFSNNPNESTRTEGITVAQQKPDGGVVGESINTVALVGKTVKGKTGAQQMNAPQQLLAVCGGRDAGGGGTITGEIWKGLLKRQFSWPLVVSPVKAASGAVAATCNLNASSTAIVSVTASSTGIWGNGATGYGLQAACVAASDGNSNHFDVIVNYGGKLIRFANINTQTGYDNTAAVVSATATTPVVIAKLHDGRPDNTPVTDGAQTYVNLAGGLEGTIASTDYVAALDAAARYPGIDIVVVCEKAVDDAGQLAINEEITRLAPLYPMVTFVAWDGKTGIAQDSTQLAASATLMGTSIATKANNVVWCTNTSFTTDPSTGLPIESGTHLDMAAVLSQTAPEIHPGDEDNLGFLSGITSLGNESIERGDFIALSAAHVSTLEKTDEGFLFHSAVATDGSQVADVRSAQYLVQSLANYWKHDVRKPFSPQRMTEVIAKGDSFVGTLQKQGRIVDSDSATLGKAWKFQWVQTDEERAHNLGKLMSQIRLMPHLLYLVIMTDISTGTSTFTLKNTP